MFHIRSTLIPTQYIHAIYTVYYTHTSQKVTPDGNRTQNLHTECTECYIQITYTLHDSVDFLAQQKIRIEDWARISTNHMYRLQFNSMNHKLIVRCNKQNFILIN